MLLRTDKRGCGQLVALPAQVTRLGRSFEAEAHVDDEAVSRFHAEIRAESGRFIITDLGSRNGTYLDERRVQSALLRDGNAVRLGSRVSFRFSVVEEDEQRALSYLHELGQHDPLTRVHNRRYLNQRLTAELAFAERHRTSVSIILLDLDHFKLVNDQHGHQAGDQVLERVALLAKEQVRTEDVVARYGGEEFMIVLRATPVAGAEVLAERIRRVVAGALFETAAGAPFQVSLSAGCASLECAGGSDASDLIRIADRRLYVAKREGRNRVVGAGGCLVSMSAPVEPPREASGTEDADALSARLHRRALEQGQGLDVFGVGE